MSSETLTIEKLPEGEKEKPVDPEVLAYFEGKAREQAGRILNEAEEFKREYEKITKREYVSKDIVENIFQSFRYLAKEPFLRIFNDLKEGKRELAITYFDEEISKQLKTERKIPDAPKIEREGRIKGNFAGRGFCHNFKN